MKAQAKRRSRPAPALTDAQSRLAADNVKLAYYLARKFESLAPDLRREDVDDAAIDGLILAARAFDPARCSKFSALANRCIRHSILASGHRANARCRRPDRPVCSIDDDDYKGEMPLAPEVDLADDGPDFRSMVLHLEPREREVLTARFRDGRKLWEVGGRLGVTRERARQIELKAL